MSYAGLIALLEKPEIQLCDSLGTAGDGLLLIWSKIDQKGKVKAKIKPTVMFCNETRFPNADWTVMQLQLN